jgi:hypothetical protein
MKKRIIVAVLVPLLIIALAGVSQAGQGKVDDPYGLLQDESDLLSHPSQIAQGEGIRFYDDYLFTYTGVNDEEDNSLDQLNTADTLTDYYYLDDDGERKDSADNVLNLLKLGKTRVEWSTGNGVSVLFDL